MSKAYILLYYSYTEATEELSDEECGRLFRAMLKYGAEKIKPELCGNEKYVWPSMKWQIDKDEKAYNDKCDKLRNNARMKKQAIDKPSGVTGGQLQSPEATSAERAEAPARQGFPCTELRPCLRHSSEVNTQEIPDRPFLNQKQANASNCNQMVSIGCKEKEKEKENEKDISLERELEKEKELPTLTGVTLTGLSPSPHGLEALSRGEISDQQSADSGQKSDISISSRRSALTGVGSSPHGLEALSNGEGFIHPSIEEVSGYCRERSSVIDPQAFFDFYASKGWKVGSQPMEDWRACVRTWEHREKQKKKKDTFSYEQRKVSNADVEARFVNLDEDIEDVMARCRDRPSTGPSP